MEKDEKLAFPAKLNYVFFMVGNKRIFLKKNI
jgi:hypothetical protein